MAYQARKIGNVEGLGEIYQVDLPLDEQIADFKEARITAPYLPLPEEVAQIRLAGVSNDFSRTRITPIALKGEPTVLIKEGLLMTPTMARLAVKAHRAGRYPEFSPEVYEVARDLAKAESGREPEDRTAIILSQSGDYDLTPEMDETRFALGRTAKKYFDKFEHKTIPLINLPADSKKSALVNYVWFSSPRSGSLLGCEGRGLGSSGCGSGAFGVRRVSGKTAEGGSPENAGYNLTTIKNANSENVHQVLGGTPVLENALAEQLNEGLMRILRNR